MKQRDEGETVCCLSLKEVRGVGCKPAVEGREGGSCIVNQAALPKVGTCKSGE